MKHPVYKMALTALVCLGAYNTPVFAQQTVPAPPTPPTPPTVAIAPSVPAAVYATNRPYNYTSTGFATAVYNTDGEVYNLNMQQDSAYRKKMQKLQEQMRDLQREMSSLRSEENRKNIAEIQKRNAERVKEYQEKFKDYDKKFTDKFSSIGQKYSGERNTSEMEKLVQRGDAKLKTKAYTKSYNIDGNDNIKIDNRFGKVTINTWAKNEVKVDVEIKAYGDDDAKAQDILDQISINDSKDQAGVSFTTSLGDENHKSNFWGTQTRDGKTSVHSAVVNYTVYMPAKSPLNISNTFGAVILPDLSGKLSIKNSFGLLSAKALTNADNEINVKYCDASILSLNGCDLKVSFGSLNLQSAEKLNADIQYSPAKIGKLSSSATINLRFGEGLQINNLDRNLKTLSIKSSYAPVKLGSLANDNADFDVTTQYGGFTYDNGNVSVTSKSPADEDRSYSTTKTYKGHIGKGSSDKVIIIKTNFSSVKFDQ